MTSETPRDNVKRDCPLCGSCDSVTQRMLEAYLANQLCNSLIEAGNTEIGLRRELTALQSEVEGLRSLVRQLDKALADSDEEGLYIHSDIHSAAMEAGK